MAGAQSSAAQRTPVLAPLASSTESKHALSTVLLQQQSRSAAVAAAAAVRSTAAAKPMARRRGPPQSRSYARNGSIRAAADQGDRGWTRSKIRPSDSDQTAHCVRTYSSIGTVTVGNTNTVPWVGGGFSLHFSYDFANNTCDAEVYLGSPQASVGTPTSVRFWNVADEFQAMSNVFRYFRITKFQASVSRLPVAVYSPSQPVYPPSVPSDQQQGGSWTNMGDPGQFLLRPWTGAPDLVNYSTGVLTSIAWDDHVRMKVKKVASASGPLDEPLALCVTPVQPMIIPQDVTPEDVGGQIRYQAAPAIDIADFKAGIQGVEGSSYGIIFYWFFPACVGAITGLLNTDIRFEMEIEYFGMKPPSAFTPPAPLLPDGTVYSDSKDALVASLTGQNVKTAERPPPPVALEPKFKVPPLQVHDDYVQVPAQAAAALPVVKQGLPATRPSTPTQRR